MSLPRRWATSFGHGASLTALGTCTPDREPEHSHVDYRSRTLPGATHRAGIDLPGPVALACLRVLWTPGHEPRQFRILVRAEPTGPLAPLDAAGRAASGAIDVIDLGGRSVCGVAIEQPPDGGHADQPDALAIRSLGLTPVEPPAIEASVVRADGSVLAPASPFPHPALPGFVLEIGGAAGLSVRPRSAQPLAQLTLSFARVGEVGTATDLAELAGSLRLRVRASAAADLEPVACTVRRADREGGVVAGRTELIVRPSAGALADVEELRLDWSAAPAIGALEDVRWSAVVRVDDAEQTPVPPRDDDEAVAERERLRTARGDPLAERLRASGLSLAAARTLVAAPAHAAALGWPAADARVGVSPGGTLQIRAAGPSLQAGSATACWHARLLLDGAPPDGRAPGDGPGTIDLTWPTARARLAVDGGATLLIEIEGPARRAELALAERDWLLPLPVALGPARAPTIAPATPIETRVGERELVLAWDRPAGETTLVRIPLSPEAAPSAATVDEARAELRARTGAILSDAIDFALPGAWDGLVRALARHAISFVRADETIRYGTWPSCYDGDVYGLEEDYALVGLSLWGHARLAMRLFRATYLTDRHLSKQHVLHDLRNGLTPWQTARLARLAGADSLDASDRDRLRACGQWTRAQRRHEVEGAVRGLLPPFRYGGDLGFPTQSLFTNAANVAGLLGLAELLPDEADEWRREAADHLRVLNETLDAVRTVDARTGLPIQPLHVGGSDEPGDYYQLALGGILQPLGLYAPDDPRIRTASAFCEQAGLLCLALPRFDQWGVDGFGIDPHYGLGMLLDAMRADTPAGRATFWTGLVGMLASSMDPIAHSFREVTPVLLPGRRAPVPAHLPGRHLGLTEPCVGGPGVILQLVRHALVSETPGQCGERSRTLRILPAPLPEWWAADGRFWLRGAPTEAGPVTIEIDCRLTADGTITLSLEGSPPGGFVVHPPEPPGRRLRGEPVSRYPALHRPGGRHQFVWHYD